MRLREYIAKLEAAGELQRITTKVDTRFEITEITDRISKSESGGKALLFENTGTEYPVLMNMMGSDKRMAMALGVDDLSDISKRIDDLLKGVMTPKNTLMDKLRMLPLLADVAKWFPRKSNSRGECQEVVWRGEEVDLAKLPILTSWPFPWSAPKTLRRARPTWACTACRYLTDAQQACIGIAIRPERATTTATSASASVCP